ncbi:MAG TPA: tRNA (adenosine(37)-N6)-threonylcarbamoyltransferase complex transferase subunit TsaD [Candidatus Tidjanibacter gallistercoris]|nr:tRNA (adenosine(37)-N6)-threonylcarbamoyltransferase complex transferase subunit TsaD [Candidatus Tidjanibacter gallistercoris]
MDSPFRSDALILGIESSCDDTSAAVLRGTRMLSNVIASQAVHMKYGGVIPELASRAHQQNIVPVVDTALKNAGVGVADLDAVAFTRGPGLLGSLLVGVSFSKGLAVANNIPLVEVNHLQGHILSHFIDMPDEELPHPSFPFLCLLVSGGHTQIVKVTAPLEMEIVGTTIDDAAGEAFDKCAKVMGLPYPGGPVIDRLAAQGDAGRFRFARPSVSGFDYSFSGLKTSFLYFLRDRMREDPGFIEANRADLCASLQKTIVDILLDKLVKAAGKFRIRDIAIAGGVSANSGLRGGVTAEGERRGWRTFLPPLKFTTDNAAMIAVTGYFRYQKGEFSSLSLAPEARIENMLTGA